MDRFLYRFIRSAPPLVKLVTALGMLIAIPSVLQLVFGTEQRLAPPSLWLPPSSVYFHVAGDAINGTELSTVIVTLAVVLLLSLMSHFTQIGLRMRAMAESPRMVQLAGVNSERRRRRHLGALELPRRARRRAAGAAVRRPAAAQLHRPARGGHRGRRPREPDQPAAGVLGRDRPRRRPGAAERLPAERERALLGAAAGASLRRCCIALLLLLPGLRERWSHDDPLAACDPPPPPLAATVGGYRFDAPAADRGLVRRRRLRRLVPHLDARQLDVHAHPGPRLLDRLPVDRAPHRA